MDSQLPITDLYHFYPRPPRGGRRRKWKMSDSIGEISIHALREEGDRDEVCHDKGLFISIHALREEGDYSLLSLSSWVRYFYPRPP